MKRIVEKDAHDSSRDRGNKSPPRRIEDSQQQQNYRRLR